ncbi:MAG: phosphatidylglycerophosphatase A [Halioglobus sp.]|nr:phosphatidylglycerophosphatase A [Halioglobus sp.]
MTPNLLRHPAQFLAFGFGSGLSPVAPGTVGTIVAVPIYFLVAHWGLFYYTLFICLGIGIGIWVCGVASRQLDLHDHPGIVWDEFVGYWITMWAVPVGWQWAVAGFLIFRFLDIVKPWPIGLFDKKVSGGLGIMMDDVLAGVLACVGLHLARAVA